MQGCGVAGEAGSLLTTPPSNPQVGVRRAVLGCRSEPTRHPWGRYRDWRAAQGCRALGQGTRSQDQRQADQAVALTLTLALALTLILTLTLTLTLSLTLTLNLTLTLTRWHKDVDTWYKRLWLTFQGSHTLLAGLLYRGTVGFSRAQTVIDPLQQRGPTPTPTPTPITNLPLARWLVFPLTLAGYLPR